MVTLGNILCDTRRRARKPTAITRACDRVVYWTVIEFYVVILLQREVVWNTYVTVVLSRNENTRNTEKFKYGVKKFFDLENYKTTQYKFYVLFTALKRPMASEPGYINFWKSDENSHSFLPTVFFFSINCGSRKTLIDAKLCVFKTSVAI